MLISVWVHLYSFVELHWCVYILYESYLSSHAQHTDREPLSGKSIRQSFYKPNLCTTIVDTNISFQNCISQLVIEACFPSAIQMHRQRKAGFISTSHTTFQRAGGSMHFENTQLLNCLKPECFTTYYEACLSCFKVAEAKSNHIHGGNYFRKTPIHH